MKNRFIYYFNVKILRGISNYIMVYLIFFTYNFLVLRNMYTNHNIIFYELFYWHMGNSLQLTLFHSVFILMLLHKMVTDNNYDIYFVMRCNNRKNLFLIKVTSSIIISISCILTSVLISLIQSIFLSHHKFEWTDFTKYIYSSIYNENLKLEDFLMPFLINLFFYFTVLNLIMLTLNQIFKQKYLAVIIMILLCLLNYSSFLSKLNDIAKYTMLGNVIIGYNDNKLNDSVNILYWVLLIFILTFIYYLSLKKTDIKEYHT